MSNMAKEALERGGGKACSASHGGDCRHYGILDLRPMDRSSFLYYSKDGGWLKDKHCMSCHENVKDMQMNKGAKSFLRYCEMGLKSAKLDQNGEAEEKALYEDHNCLMILCVP